MTERGTNQDADPIRDRYRVTYGVVPVGIDERLRVAEAFDRLPVEVAISTLRHRVLHENAL
jgi:hypothetical protein